MKEGGVGVWEGGVGGIRAIKGHGRVRLFGLDISKLWVSMLLQGLNHTLHCCCSLWRAWTGQGVGDGGEAERGRGRTEVAWWGGAGARVGGGGVKGSSHEL